MKNRTDLLLEYIQMSRDFDFPDDVELALENDYARDPSAYSLWTLQMVQTVVMLVPDITPEQVIGYVHCDVWRQEAARVAACQS